MKEAKKRLVILDTHAILHRAYHALPEFSSSKGEPTGALFGLISMLVKIINDLRPDYIAAAFDLPGPTFRDAAYKEYKGTRQKTDDALVVQIDRARDVLAAFGIPLYEAPGFEADDVVGTIVEKTKKVKGLDVIIASGDKDTLQLVDGERIQAFMFKKGLNDTALYDEAAVKERYGFGPTAIPDLKGIAGDASDNIKGVPGVGEGSALKLLQTYGTLEKLYAAIKKEGIEKMAEKTSVQVRFVKLVAEQKEEAQFSKMLATIRRDAPIAFELPTKTWKEGADTEKVLDMLADFEFRSLGPRVRQILGAEKEVEAEGPALLAALPPEFPEARIAVWLLDSSISDPGLDDVYRLGKTKDFGEALKSIRSQIQEKNLTAVYEKIELPLMPILRRMESRGVLIDKKFFTKLSATYHKEMEQVAERIYAAAGGPFNISSPKQLGGVLFDKLGLSVKNQKKTAGGARSTRESELEKLKHLHPIIDEVLAYREVQKLLSTYIDTIPKLLDKENRLHTSYIQTGTTTGRLGSQNPNLQNIPIKSELGRAIRHGFVASPGMTLVAFDYSQIELRIAAFLSGDPALTEIFKTGRDVHNEVASRVFGLESKEVTYEQRRRAKVINFGILYGMGVTSLQQTLGTNRKEAQEFYNQYFAAFPKLADYLEEVKAHASRLGYTETHFGRRRYFEGIRSAIPFVRAAAERMAINAPIQGTQSDVIKLAMIELDAFFEREGRKGHLLLQVHDELVFEIEKEKVKEYATKIKSIMEEVVPLKERKGIPFTAEGKSGPNWGELQKL